MTAWLDRIWGASRCTCSSSSPSALGVTAVVLGLLGWFSVRPLPLLASAAVLLAAYIGNGVSGVIFRTKPQLSSMVITALLLLFIFQPTLYPAGLAVLALAATIAAATNTCSPSAAGTSSIPPAAAAFIVGSSRPSPAAASCCGGSAPPSCCLSP